MKDRNGKISGMINDIREAQRIWDKARMEYRRATAPLLYDMSLVPTIYGWFEELAGKQQHKLPAVERRKQFRLIILCLYAPYRLCSGKMPKGLRRALSSALGTECGSVISTNAREATHRYETYRRWAEDVEAFLSEIVSRLKADKDAGSVS